MERVPVIKVDVEAGFLLILETPYRVGLDMATCWRGRVTVRALSRSLPRRGCRTAGIRAGRGHSAVGRHAVR